MLPLRTLSYTLTILLLSSCSVTKSLYKDKEVSRYNPNVSLASKNYSKPAGEDTSDKEAKASGKQQQPVSDSLPETETHKKLPYRYPLPRMTFGETESANVRIPMSLNNPFPPSGELEIPLAELESDFCYPYPGKQISGFGYRGRSMHTGVDIKAVPNDTIRAAFNGKVRIKAFERRGYGYYVVLRHPNGLETIYGHLSKILVEENQIVRAGETIGLGGNTGRSTGSHLHFETRFLGQAINPAEIIDFENGVPHQDTYVFHNVKINGRRSNIYTSSSDRLVYHRVKSGDTLGKIARIYGTSVNELCRLNGLKSTSVLRIGQSIRCSAGAVTSAKAGTSKPAASASVKQTVKTTVAADAAAVASINQTSDAGRQEATPVYHRVKSGDTLGAIAAKYGTTVSKLCELNGITKTTILKLGRSLRCS